MRRWTRGLLLTLLGTVGCPGTEGDLLLRVPGDLGAADLPPVLQCITAILGDSVQCETLAVWLDRAAQACMATGGKLAGGGIFDSCGANSFLYLKYTCCPTGDTSNCSAELQGGTTSCKDEATWRANAALSCSATSTIPMNIALSESCGTGLYRYVNYLCCPAM